MITKQKYRSLLPRIETGLIEISPTPGYILIIHGRFIIWGSRNQNSLLSIQIQKTSVNWKIVTSNKRRMIRT